MGAAGSGHQPVMTDPQGADSELLESLLVKAQAAGISVVNKQFQEQVRAQLKPGTSALFMILEQMTADKTLEALSSFGGNVLKTSLSKEDEAELQEALHGTTAS